MPATNSELDAIKNKIRRDYEEGVATFKQLSEKYSIKEGTIKSWASREGWVKGKKQSEAKQSKEAIQSEKQLKKQLQLKKKDKVATKNEKVKKDATMKGKKVKVATKKDASKNSSKNKFQIQEYIEPEKPKELTEKEQLFCFYFVNVHQFNATKSYQAAYGCTYESARRLGSLLLTKIDIRAEIDRLKEIKYQSIMLKADDLVEKHMRIAFSQITDFVEFSRVEVPVMGPFGPVMVKQTVINGLTGKEEERAFPVTKIINEVRIKESSEVDGSLIKSISQGKDGIKIEPYDAQKSMDWLERYFQWNPMDRHKVDFDRKRLALQEQELTQKSKTGSAIQETIANAQGQVQTLANLLNGAKPNRNIENFEKEG